MRFNVLRVNYVIDMYVLIFDMYVCYLKFAVLKTATLIETLDYR